MLFSGYLLKMTNKTNKQTTDIMSERAGAAKRENTAAFRGRLVG